MRKIQVNRLRYKPDHIPKWRNRNRCGTCYVVELENMHVLYATPASRLQISTAKPLEEYSVWDRAHIVCSMLNAQGAPRHRLWILWQPGYIPPRSTRIIECVLHAGWYNSQNKVPRKYSGVEKRAKTP